MHRFIALAAMLIVAPAYGDSSVPAPPERAGAWTARCMARLERAQVELAREEPAFAGGAVTLNAKTREVRFVARVADREHARFFAGAPGEFTVSIKEQRSKEPGAIGVDVGSPRDSQASIGLSQWSKERYATIDAGIVEGARAFRFSRWFKPAMLDCLE